MKNRIGLIDCNNFFVSCERLFRPDLAGRPVVVLSSNDGCVVSRSQEIKDKGIPMGVPYFQVKDMLSDIGTTVFSSNFTLYRDISRRVFSVIEREVGSVERYSIDECFFTVAATAEPEAMVQLREMVHQEVGIPVSIGVGLSRTQAKFAAAQAKKSGGIWLFGQPDTYAIFNNAPLSGVWGVGRSRSAAFLKKRLTSVGEYLRSDRRSLYEWFGVEGVRLLDELQGGTQSLHVAPAKPTRSHTSSRSFGMVCTDLRDIKLALTGHLEVILEKLDVEKTLATSLRIMVYPSRYSDHILSGVSAEIALPAPTNNRFLLTKLLHEAVSTHCRSGVPYKKAGITVITVAPYAQSSALFPLTNERTDEVSQVVSLLNQRFGLRKVRIGAVKEPVSAAWLPRQIHCSPRYTTEWTAVRSVIAKDTCS